jgi:hypothetical protein
MGEAGGASRRAAPRQSLELQAARSARCVCGVHSRSPTMRRRSNPQDTTRHSAAAAGGGLRINQLTAEARPGLLMGCICYHGYLAQSVGTHAGRGMRAKAMAPPAPATDYAHTAPVRYLRRPKLLGGARVLGCVACVLCVPQADRTVARTSSSSSSDSSTTSTGLVATARPRLAGGDSESSCGGGRGTVSE